MAKKTEVYKDGRGVHPRRVVRVGPGGASDAVATAVPDWTAARPEPSPAGPDVVV